MKKTLIGIFGAVVILAAVTMSAHDGSAHSIKDEANGIFYVTHGTTRYEIQCKDTDGMVTDGLPEQCRGVGASNWHTLTPGTASVCLGGTDAWCDNAPFDFTVYVDIANHNDTDAQLPALDYANPIAFFGGNGTDTYTGGSEGDYLHGGAGNDTLSGGAGNDFIAGTDGNDDIYGDTGDDLLLGGTGVDYMEGGDGNDVLNGGGSPDILAGGPGHDVVHGGVGNEIGGACAPNGDILLGEDGEDWLQGGACPDTLDGGPDADFLLAVDMENEAGVDGGDAIATNACYVDNGVLDQTVNCTNYTPDPNCSDYLYASGMDGQNNLVLGKLHPNTGVLDGGGIVTLPPVTLTGTSGLAVNPFDCQLWAVLDDNAGNQILATISSMGNSLVTTQQYTYVAPADPIVDIAFDTTFQLHGLTRSVAFVAIDTTGSPGTITPIHEGWTRNSVGVHMAYDDPDTGFFVVTTHDDDEDVYYIDMFFPDNRGNNAIPYFPLTDTTNPLNDYQGEAITTRSGVPGRPAGKLQLVDSAGDMWLCKRKWFECTQGNQADVSSPMSITMTHYDW